MRDNYSAASLRELRVSISGTQRDAADAYSTVLIILIIFINRRGDVYYRAAAENPLAFSPFPASVCLLSPRRFINGDRI